MYTWRVASWEARGAHINISYEYVTHKKTGIKAKVSEEILKWHCHSLSLSAEF